jgi:hypothetical protein
MAAYICSASFSILFQREAGRFGGGGARTELHISASIIKGGTLGGICIQHFFAVVLNDPTLLRERFS